jgi:hypothetical protein
MISVKVQCDIMELLGLDDLQQTEFPKNESDGGEFEELLAKRAIENVTRRMDSDEGSEEVARLKEN